MARKYILEILDRNNVDKAVFISFNILLAIITIHPPLFKTKVATQNAFLPNINFEDLLPYSFAALVLDSRNHR